MAFVLQWDDTYSVKINALDSQHKKLFDLVNELHQAMLAGRGKDVTGNILGGLIEYTASHFAAEEKLMEKHNFPGLRAHCSEHQLLTGKVLEFKKQFDQGKATLTMQLMQFLQGWLRNHILSVAHRYSEFFNQQGVH